MSEDQPKAKRTKLSKPIVNEQNMSEDQPKTKRTKLSSLTFKKIESYTGNSRLDHYIENNKNKPNYDKGYATLIGEITDIDKLKVYEGVKVRSTIRDKDSNTWIVTMNVNHPQLISLSKETWVKQLQSPTPVFPV